MTNEQLAILLEHIINRLSDAIYNIESELPDDLRRKPEALPDEHPLKPFQNRKEYFPCLLEIKELNFELKQQVDLLTNKKAV